MIDIPEVSIIIPTYNESENIERIVSTIFNLGFDIELIVVDDDSPDGTGVIVEGLQTRYNNLKVIRRKERGLASAVVEGFKAADSGIIGVMDADFSHPFSAIKKIIAPIQHGRADIVVGSRYIKGGEIQGWPLIRKLTSRGATLLARPLTSVKDPVSGFFFLKKEVLNGVHLNPRGYKIGLEVLVKGRYNDVIEIPYTFTNRAKGKSKLSLKEYLNYILHLEGLYRYKIKNQFIRNKDE